jgi:guanylate kinase
VGKDTIIERLLRADSNLTYSVSCTTRPPRPGERDGVHYTFISRERFEELIEKGHFLEWATYGGNLYGTPVGPVEEARAKGRDVLLKIEVQGGRKVRERVNDAIFIFIAPPSTEELVRRQEQRNSLSPDEVIERLGIAEKEMTYARDYDHIVVNDDLDRAVEELLQIIHRERERQT